MSLEAAQYVHQLNPSNPSGADRLKDGDDHIRMLKAVLKATFPGITGPLDPEVTHEFLNGLVGGGTPFGLISPFYGEAAPTGWALCNGATVNKSDGSGTFVTPDLRGRTLVGATAEVVLGTAFGQASRTVTSAAGGAHTHAATAANAGAHTHTVSGSLGTATTGITANISRDTVDDGGSAPNLVRDFLLQDPGHTHSLSGLSSGSAGDHTHTLTVPEAAAHAHSVTVDVTQPSFAINYIIKI